MTVILELVKPFLRLARTNAHINGLLLTIIIMDSTALKRAANNIKIDFLLYIYLPITEWD